MNTFKEKADDFLAQKRIAVAGVSSTSGAAAANGIYKSLRSRDYTVFPVNPNSEVAEGDVCYPSVKDIPDGVDGVIIATPASAALPIVRDCAEAGITRVWMHYNPMFGKSNSSVSDEAVAFANENGITVIDGGCPLMFVDFAHKCMRWMLGTFGKLPA